MSFFNWLEKRIFVVLGVTHFVLMMYFIGNEYYAALCIYLALIWFSCHFWFDVAVGFDEHAVRQSIMIMAGTIGTGMCYTVAQVGTPSHPKTTQT